MRDVSQPNVPSAGEEASVAQSTRWKRGRVYRPCRGELANARRLADVSRSL